MCRILPQQNIKLSKLSTMPSHDNIDVRLSLWTCLKGKFDTSKRVRMICHSPSNNGNTDTVKHTAKFISGGRSTASTTWIMQFMCNDVWCDNTCIIDHENQGGYGMQWWRPRWECHTFCYPKVWSYLRIVSRNEIYLKTLVCMSTFSGRNRTVS